MQSLPYVLEVGSQEVILTPDPAHEFTATTEQVALGYGVSASTIREQKRSNGEEFVEGKHFLSVRIPDAGNGNLKQTLWTKRGIVRLGFFIRSARARMFRDMAEDLVIGQLAHSVANCDAVPALISARGVAAGLGCSAKSAMNRLSYRQIQPTHHCFEPVCGAPTFLFPLEEVEAVWPAGQFEPHRGEALPGTAPVRQAITASTSGKIARQHRPRLLPTDTSTEQLARRLLSLEAQKRAVLKELAALA
ncbi:hypothetical protein [Deinococcus daejeonensis]|uniref:Bro-N domain-containing protein n=1 Tax=Deinococcus daejeonensis TaxID=1007098 RepID=A0ABQ2IYT6_9DEIO|nr:hypothetical protein [Deinococcus daejeonensis]GGN32424.1 hypothetical protein GCM10010842_09080 [Deinococcus daejeonensis]